MAKAKKYLLLLTKDSNENNAKKEQYKVFQLDGSTIQIPIGKQVEVPKWVADRAKEIYPDKAFVTEI